MRSEEDQEHLDWLEAKVHRQAQRINELEDALGKDYTRGQVVALAGALGKALHALSTPDSLRRPGTASLVKELIQVVDQVSLVPPEAPDQPPQEESAKPGMVANKGTLAALCHRQAERINELEDLAKVLMEFVREYFHSPHTRAERKREAQRALALARILEEAPSGLGASDPPTSAQNENFFQVIESPGFLRIDQVLEPLVGRLGALEKRVRYLSSEEFSPGDMEGPEEGMRCPVCGLYAWGLREEGRWSCSACGG